MPIRNEKYIYLFIYKGPHYVIYSQALLVKQGFEAVITAPRATSKVRILVKQQYLLRTGRSK
jgi:hypothetical protein